MNAEQRKRLNALMSLRQHYRWSVVLFEYAEPFVVRHVNGETLTDDDLRRSTALLAFWFGSLWVVLEGWREMGLSHSAVDPYLASPHTQILRRFRNFVFHYQSTMESDKFEAMFAEQGVAIVWVLGFALDLSKALLPLHDTPNAPYFFHYLMTGDGRLDCGAA